MCAGCNLGGELACVVGRCGRLVQAGQDRAVVVRARNGAQLTGAGLQARVAVLLGQAQCDGRVREAALAVADEHARATEVEQEGLRLPPVIKQDGRRTEFSRDKLVTGFRRALHKRAVPTEKVDAAVERYLATPAMPPEAMFDHLYAVLPAAYAEQQLAVSRGGEHG